MGKKPLDPAIVEQVRSMTKAGHSQLHIAGWLGLSRATVQKYRTELNTRKELERQHVRKFAPDEINKRRKRSMQRHRAKRNKPMIVIEERLPHRLGFDWAKKQVAEAQKQGATFCRFSYHENDSNRFLFEAWEKRPYDQGKLRWSENGRAKD